MMKPNQRLIAAIGLMLLSGFANAETIGIIGTGDVAGALGPAWAEAGHTIVYGSRTPQADKVQTLVAKTGSDTRATTPPEAAAAADVIVLAVPAEVAVSVLQGLGDVAGKPVIDPTNAFDIGEDRLAVRTTERSVGEALQAAAPDAHVVKAFNAIWYGTMADPARAGGPVTIPMVGDNDEAKAVVAELITDIGFAAADLGPIRYAEELEGMLIVWMNARLNGRAFNYYFQPEPR